MPALQKIGLILLTIVVLPALVFIANEFYGLSASEAMIGKIYDQQLETILYSVNQHAWDVADRWAGTLVRTFEEAEGEGAAAVQGFLAETPTVRSVVLMDTLREGVQGFGPSPFPLEALRAELAAGVLPEEVARRLLKDARAGYRKLQPLLLDAASEQPVLLLVFATTAGGPAPMLAGLAVDDQRFVEDVLTPKLQEAAREEFLLGVFRSSTAAPVYTTGDFSLDEARQVRHVWLFPDYVLGIRLRGTSIAELAHVRFRRSLFVITVLAVALFAGGWLVYRNIRREVDLVRMKSAFVSNVSHELRTPLALIRMYAETLELGRVQTEEKRQAYYQIISRETDRLTRLVNNILNFSRIESGQKQYVYERLDLNALVEDIVTSYTPALQQRGFEPAVTLADPLPPILGDAEGLSEALLNLIDNAVKYSGDARHLGIATGRERGFAYLEVCDRGIGIPPEERDRIFDQFYRISNGLVHNTKGTGLGLALVKHIVEAHGGTIRVQSRLGQGSCFRLLLPADEGVPAVRPPSPTESTHA